MEAVIICLNLVPNYNLSFQNKLLQEFKKSMRMPDKNMDHRKSLFRGSQSLGSISSIFSATTRKKSPASHNVTKKLEKSKSEETLNKNTDIDTSDSDDDTTEISKSEPKVSPFIAKRYLT